MSSVEVLSANQGQPPILLKKPSHRENTMGVLKLLFTSDAGLASLAVIAFMIVMGIYLYFHVKKLSRQNPGKQGWD
jgi:hypothetical protein